MFERIRSNLIKTKRVKTWPCMSQKKKQHFISILLWQEQWENREREWERETGIQVEERSGQEATRQSTTESNYCRAIYKEVMSLRAWSSSSLMALYFSFWAYSSSTRRKGSKVDRWRMTGQRKGSSAEETGTGNRWKKEKRKRLKRGAKVTGYQTESTRTEKNRDKCTVPECQEIWKPEVRKKGIANSGLILERCNNWAYMEMKEWNWK